MGSFCPCFKRGEPKKESVLESAKRMKMTKGKGSKPITTRVNRQLITRAQQEYICRQCFEMKVLLMDKYSDFSEILYNLYLTGIGGINAENIRNKEIKCIINCTFESAGVDITGIESVRIPVIDSEDDDLSLYFDEVCELIDRYLSAKKAVVVHCLAGVSRSSTIVIAYLMKCKRFRLRAAYLHVKKRRDFIKPNNGFFEQLIKYENKLYKTNTVRMVSQTTKAGNSVKVPDVMLDLFREETLSELDDQTTVDSVFSDTISTRRDLF